MSQTRTSLRYVEKNSGFDGYIVRPLSIKKLPETIPEKQGLINRKSLYDFTGRSRKPQMALAEKLGIYDYPGPGGGCLLTEQVYSIRLRDIFDYQQHCTENDLHLLKHGRHFRISENAKAIVGRDEKDNNAMMEYYSDDYALIKSENIPGPTVFMAGEHTRENLITAGEICAGYIKKSDNPEYLVNITTAEGSEIVRVEPALPDYTQKFMI